MCFSSSSSWMLKLHLNYNEITIDTEKNVYFFVMRLSHNKICIHGEITVIFVDATGALQIYWHITTLWCITWRITRIRGA